ncbi:MAG: sugar transferase [Chloroflexota bacterium]
MNERQRKLAIARWALFISDVVLINLAFAASYYLRYELELFRTVDPVNYVPYSAYWGLQLGYNLVLILILRLEGAWRLRRGASFLDEVYTIINGTTTSMAIVLVVIFGFRPLAFSRLLLLYVSVLTVVLLSISRLTFRSLRSAQRRRGVGVDRTLIVGGGEVARAVLRTLVALPDLGYRVVGYVLPDTGEEQEPLGRFPNLGTLDRIPEILEEHQINEVIITLPSSQRRRIQRILQQCRARGARGRIVPDFFQLSLQRVDVDNLGGIPLMGFARQALGRWPRLLKRTTDIVSAIVSLTLASPIMLLVAIAIRIESKGPVVFRQERLGQDANPFQVLKFRSMRLGAEKELSELRDINEVDGPIFKIKDDPRLTSVGRIIRRTSLDELPQFINVLRGEMSLVGPRPPLASEVEEYVDWQRKRLDVKPGLTGLWQVSGRSDLTFDEMCLLDIYYIENWSLWLDLHIILRTIPSILFARGAY